MFTQWFQEGGQNWLVLVYYQNGGGVQKIFAKPLKTVQVPLPIGCLLFNLQRSALLFLWPPPQKNVGELIPKRFQ
jgi:hypothetical protein